MQDVVSTPSQVNPGGIAVLSRVRSEVPSLRDGALALFSSAFLIFAFPSFDFWPLAWVGLVPLLVIVAHKPQPWRCFLLGWLFGAVFFYGSCYWLTYSMIHFGGLPAWLSFALLLPITVVAGGVCADFFVEGGVGHC